MSKIKFLGLNSFSNLSYPIIIGNEQLYVTNSLASDVPGGASGYISHNKYVSNLLPYTYYFKTPDDRLSGHFVQTNGEVFNPMAVGSFYRNVPYHLPLYSDVFLDKFVQDGDVYYRTYGSIYNYTINKQTYPTSFGYYTNSTNHIHFEAGFTKWSYSTAIMPATYMKDLFSLGISYNIETCFEAEHSNDVMIFSGASLSGMNRCYTFPITTITGSVDADDMYYAYSNTNNNRNYVGNVLGPRTIDRDETYPSALFITTNKPNEIMFDASGYIEDKWRYDGQAYQSYSLSSLNNAQYYLPSLYIESSNVSSYIIGSDVWCLSGDGASYYNPIVSYVHFFGKNSTEYFNSFARNDFNSFSLFTISYPYTISSLGQMNVGYNGDSYSLTLPKYIMSKPVGTVSGYLVNSQIDFNYEVPEGGDEMTLRYPTHLIRYTYNNRQVRLNFVDMLGENIINPFESSATGSIYNFKGARSILEDCIINCDEIECIPSAYICVDPQSYSVVI